MSEIELPLYWFAVNGGHDVRWDFFLSTPDISPELKSKDNPVIKVRQKDCGRRGLYGITIYNERRVYLNALYPDDDIWRSAIHELGHVALEPWTDELAKMFGDKAEEEFVSHIEMGFSSLLPQIGFQLPALPFGTDAMRKRRRKRKK